MRALTIAHITVDCEHAHDLAPFWSAALDRQIDPGQPEASEHCASIGRVDPVPGVPALLLVRLGATIVADRDEWGTRWTTLTDPEGNEFCVASH